ncbi:2-polyprenylphenol 6-hydroxylase [Camelimonas abortus]|uniref:2-polyprenylphenol 6-hydroxylase n=1 Tax=Camelimonas abortus TaxID=1017184 RepID=A0ABV7LE06_9HYPH
MFSTLIHGARLVGVGFVFAREGALALVDPALLPPAARLGLRLARLLERRDVAAGGGGEGRLAAALTRLGPNWVKLGQFMATRPDVVGVRIARELERLQDRMPPFPTGQARAIIEQSLGRPFDEMFVEFSEPVGAASIAQVHMARLAPGARRRAGEADSGAGAGLVAVKVLRPGVRARFQRDLGAMRFAARAAERLLPSARRLRPLEVVETLARSVAIEMDLRLEAAALSEMAANTAGDPDFRTPRVEWSFTERDVMTSEWIDGVKLTDLAAVDAAGFDRKALAAAIIQSFLRHALRDGFFHADMHPGNLFVDRTGRLVAVDFGIMGRLGHRERRFLAEILYGFITRDYRRVAEVHFEAGYVPRAHSVDDFAQAIRAIGEPIHNRRADEISMGRLLTLLFEVTALFQMQTRPELVMLQKTMVVVEGVARSLDPHLDMWRTADPVVREWIARNLGPAGRLEEAGRGLQALAARLGALPETLERCERVLERLETATRTGFALDRESVERIGRAEARGMRAAAVALWVIAALLAALAWRAF